MTDKNNGSKPSGAQNRFFSYITDNVKAAVADFGGSVEKKLKSSEGMTLALIKGVIRQLIVKVLFLALSYVLGRAGAPFDTYPFGIALLCSASGNILCIYSGLILSAFSHGSETLPFFLVYTAGVILRAALSYWLDFEDSDIKRVLPEQSPAGRLKELGRRLFNEPFSLRLLASIVCSLSIGLARLITDGFLYYDLFGLIACVVASPLLCYAYYVLFESKNPLKPIYELSVAAFLFSLVYAVRNYYVLGFSLATVAAFLITLYISKKFGLLRGCVAGLFVGFGCGRAMAPMFALAGFASGILYGTTLFGAVLAACAVGLLYGIAGSGFSSFQTLLPELAASSAIFLPLCHYNMLPSAERFMSKAQKDFRASEAAIIADAKLSDSVRSIEDISASLDSLSATVAALSDKLKRPDIMNLKRICERDFEKYCNSCPLTAVCHGREALGTADTIGKLTAALDRNGRVELGDVPTHFAEKCNSIMKILSEINLSYAKRLEELIKNDRLSVFAIDYKTMSKLLANASSEKQGEYAFDRELAAKLARALRYMNFDADGIYVYGERKKHILLSGIDLGAVRLGSLELKRALENICETGLSAPVFSIDDDSVSLTCESVPGYKVTSTTVSERMSGIEPNGDTASAFETEQGYSYFLISDGMGSGREAAITSKLCTLFLSKLLGAGCPKSVVIEMLNGFIRSKNEECSATVDLVELDLYSGKGCFVKSGAAPSFILREGNIYKLQSKTLPIGILRDTDAEQINFDMKNGDIIVMFSDGVAATLEESTWLTELLSFDFEQDLEMMARKILESAEKNNNKRDDMTVGIIKIEKLGHGQ